MECKEEHLQSRLISCIITDDGFADSFLCTEKDRSLSYFLNKIHTWLNGHTREFVIVDLEDFLDNANTPNARLKARELAVEEIKKVTSRLYTPKDHDGKSDGSCRTFPLDLTKGELVDQGKQWILYTAESSGCSGGRAWNDYVWQFPYGQISKGGEGFQVNIGLRSSNVMDAVYEDRAFGGSDKDYLNINEARTVIEEGAGVIGIDKPSRMNRHKTLIWSWGENEPAANGGDCAVQTPNGRWAAKSCSNTYKFGCQRVTDGSWKITTSTGTFDKGPAMCRALGDNWEFILPANGGYNAQLQKSRSIFDISSNVWIAYKKVDNKWKIAENSPPVCRAGGPYEKECTNNGRTTVDLDGSSSSDANSDALTFSWTTSCPPDNTPIVGGSPAIVGTADCDVSLTVSDGLEQDSCSTQISVIDTTPPQVALNGQASVTLECNVDSYTELGAKAEDICDTTVTAATVDGDTVDVQTVGTYVKTYKAKDASGNEAITVHRTVQIQDTIDPSVTACPDPSAVLWDEGCQYVYSPNPPNVSDICDLATQGYVQPSGGLDPTIPELFVGYNTLTYRALDGSGNSEECSWVVSLNSPPVAQCKNVLVTVADFPSLDSNADGLVDPAVLDRDSYDQCVPGPDPLSFSVQHGAADFVAPTPFFMVATMTVSDGLDSDSCTSEVCLHTGSSFIHFLSSLLLLTQDYL